MAQFKTDLTLLQLNALVTSNGLKEGLQYKVTDKGWLLTAISENSLTVVGVLKLINGDTMPDYLEGDTIYIDTGAITSNIQSVPFQINISKKYYAISAHIHNIGTSDAAYTFSFVLAGSEIMHLSNNDLFAGYMAYINAAGVVSDTTLTGGYSFQLPVADYILEFYAAGVDNLGIRAIVKLEKNKISF